MDTWQGGRWKITTARRGFRAEIAINGANILNGTAGLKGRMASPCSQSISSCALPWFWTLIVIWSCCLGAPFGNMSGSTVLLPQGLKSISLTCLWLWLLFYSLEGTKPPLFWGRVAKFCISAGKTWSRVGQRPEALSLSKLLLPFSPEGHYLGRLMVMQAERWIQRVNVTRALTFLWNKCFHSCVCKGSLLIPWLWPSVCFLRSSPNNFCICSSDSGDIASVFSPS